MNIYTNLIVFTQDVYLHTTFGHIGFINKRLLYSINMKKVYEINIVKAGVLTILGNLAYLLGLSLISGISKQMLIILFGAFIMVLPIIVITLLMIRVSASRKKGFETD